MTADPDRLDVWHEQRLVGRLWRGRDGIGFRYDERWVERDGFPVSLSLPFGDGGSFKEGEKAHSFFANLLPEGDYRERIVDALKIPDTDFGLLRALGGECAGAFSILPAGERPAAERDYREVSIDSLLSPFRRRAELARPGSRGAPRLSLAGAQDKCPVLFRDGAFFLPEGGAASSHIVKFEVPKYRHLPAYETFTMMLAEAVGLPVVDIEWRAVGETSYALIKRYDRREDGDGRIARLHQEDFCQALGYGHQMKYEEDGGPSFADCCRLVEKASALPEVDRERLLRWQIFNVLAGNSDGHAKNLSLLRRPDGELRLAPFYDLICTRAVDRVDHRLALFVGRIRDPGAVAAKHWDEMAERCGFEPGYVRGHARDMAARLPDELEPARRRFRERCGELAALQRIERVVTRQCRRVAKTLRGSA